MRASCRRALGVFTGLVRSELTDMRVSAIGYVRLDPTKLAAGLLRSGQ